MAPLTNTEVGKSLNSQKGHLRTEKVNEDLPQNAELNGLTRENVSFEDKIKLVEDFIVNIGKVKAADGRVVNLASPDYDGKNYSLGQRAKHLISTSGTDNFRARKEAADRAPFVAAIPNTLTNADLVAEGKWHGLDRVYYIKKYNQGTHLVVTDNKGKIIDQGGNDLITQYGIDLRKNKFDPSFRITYKRSGSAVSDTPEASLQSSTTITLSNSAGGNTSMAQTESIPKHSSNINIQK